MPESQGFHPEPRGQHRALRDAHEHITEVDQIVAGLSDDCAGRLTTVRGLLRTIGRLLDEAGTSTCAEPARSDERTQRELRAVLSALDIPTDRRAFDLNAEVQAIINSRDFETDAVVRERLRHLRDVLAFSDLE